SSIARKPLDAHLMIVDPDRYVAELASMGVSYVSVHYEACNHLHRSLQNIRSHGMKAGVALNPHTPASVLEYVLEYADFVLVMSVNPGFGGQSFIESSLRKIAEIKAMIVSKGLSTLIQVDGGVNLKNAGALKESGADSIVVGSAITSAEDPVSVISALKRI
ncbi:MAG: ribulose-phosphate 3-epimerase, partial [Candidatus Coprenecus sp.]|nr:ribulose-phosphate 3-epimerase [Candidatus Coprenecus sp.]